MIQYIKDPTKDMHRDTAAELFFLEPKEVSKEARYVAKNRFVFPQFYGSYYIDCAKHLWEAVERMDLKVGDTPLKKHLRKNGIKKLGECNPRESPRKGTFEYHVKEVEDLFWNERFPVYTNWKRKWYERYTENGYAVAKTGFKFQGIYKRNQIINFPVQGAAFQCLLWTLIQVHKWIRKNKLKSKLCSQVHDSIIGSIHPDEIQNYLNKITILVEKDLPKHWDWINVPLAVEVEVSDIGTSWYDKKEWTKKDGLWGPK
jgi:hypothetical protein